MEEEKKMKYDDFNKKVEQHLKDYKEKVLGIPGCGYYGDKEEAHILPCGTWNMNYMGDDALEASKTIKQHTGWYNLKSSQTMCVNYFAPLLRKTSKGYEHLNWFLEKYLHIHNVHITEYEFEHPYKPVINKQATEFDFWCMDKQNRYFYFEIKYTENGITSKGGGGDPEKTFHEIYEPLVEKDNCYLSFCAENDKWKLFMNKHYQAYRNMAMADENTGSYSIFITSNNNNKTKRDFESAKKDIIDYQKCEPHNIISLFWEEIIPQTIEHFSEKDGKGKWKTPELQGYYREFANKYLLNDAEINAEIND